MKAERLNLDKFSTLPQHIIEKILILLPIRDALRTSILSRKWRYHWTSMPNIVFNDKLHKVSNDKRWFKKYKFVNAISHVLLLHSGPIQEFRLSIYELEMASEIDLIVLHLSRNNNVKKFVLNISTDYYKLPCSFFLLTGLVELSLTKCGFEPPLVFNEFSRLKLMFFKNVKITVKMLQRFLTNCPLLEHIAMVGYREGFIGGDKFTFTELLEYLPLVKSLIISKHYIKHFALGGMPLKLPTSLVSLNNLYLEMCFMKQDELSSTLCLIRSSPNLKIIYLKMYDNQELPFQQTSMKFHDPQVCSGFSLDHLQELKIAGFSNSAIAMEFVKLILAKSHFLREAQIELNANVSADEEVKILRDLIRLPFPRASPAAKLIIKRP